MELEKYKSVVKEKLYEYLKGFDEKEVKDYIDNIDAEIEKEYNSQKECSEIVGTNLVNPLSCACMLSECF